MCVCLRFFKFCVYLPPLTSDRPLRPFSLVLHQTEGCTFRSTSPLSLRIGKINGGPFRLSTCPSRFCPSISPRTRSLGAICGDWSRNLIVHSATRTSHRFKKSTRSCSSLSFSTVRRLLSRMSHFSCLEIYSNTSWPGGTQGKPAENREEN